VESQDIFIKEVLENKAYMGIYIVLGSHLLLTYLTLSPGLQKKVYTVIII
jgi:hypothetical protein